MNGNLRFKICDLRDPSRAKERGAAIPGQRAFTLIEMLVTVALLAIIILGLTAMFSQTRRAFTSSLAQVDVLEAGRAAADLISRDLEQMTPAYYSNVPNFYVITSGSYGQASGLLLEQLANPTDVWTNIIQEMVFLTPSQTSNGQWTAIGYRLQSGDESNSIGSLYRFNASGLNITNIGANSFAQQMTSSGSSYFFTPNALNTASNFNRIIDGVTYFRVLAYKTNGVLITNGNSTLVNPATIQEARGDYPGYDYQYIFYSNATPAYVEIELGIMETQAYEKYRSLGPGTQPADAYLTSHPGVVHIFRQRIPIRTADPTTVFY